MNTAEPTYIPCGGGVRLIRGRTMKTRDGVTLVSDHYYPPQAGPAPTLLMRQPYGRDIASTVVYAHPVWFAQQGYNVVIQDVRGRGDSGGQFYPFRYEAHDGFDTVEWISKLPECTGKVGMYGFSYQGLTQLLAAVEQPPGLVAIAPGMTAGDLYNGWFYSGGMFKLSSGMGWANQMLREDALRLNLVATQRLDRAWANLSPTFSLAPYGKSPHLTASGLAPYFRDWTSHHQPGPYWAELDVSTRWDKITIPALHVAGWYDTFAQGSIDTFLNMQNKAGSERARANQFLIAGPWQHIPWSRQIGEMDLGADAVLPTDQLLVDWFDLWLKDSPTKSSDTYPKVQLFTLGSNTWSEPGAWPHPKQVDRTLFLGSNGKANSLHGDGVLSQQEPPIESDAPRDCVVCDPAVPVPSPGAMGAPGPFRQNRIEAGNNVLVYTGLPLGTDLWICGQPRVLVYVQSSHANCDLVVKLVRVDLQGNAWNITMGAARASQLFGPSFGLKDLQFPDEIRAWEISLDATSCRFFAGEQIRLEIAGNCFPLFDRSSGSVEIPAHEATPKTWLRVTHQIVHEKAFPSQLILPEVPV